MFQYPAKVLRVVDGDTLKLDIDLGFYTHVEQTVRLAHINTPETVNYGAQGIDDPAMAYIERVCGAGMQCVAEISRQEKYGRWLATIMYCPGVTDRDGILRDPHVLNDELVREGFAKKYEGGKK